jgi:acetyl-CoA carboxylase biotin carboxyl carrier protein
MDLRKIKKLIDLLEESNLSEIEIKEGEESVRLARTPRGGVAMSAPAPQVHAEIPRAMPMLSPVQAATGGRPAAPASASLDAGGGGQDLPDGQIVRAPMVGTFYTSPRPTSRRSSSRPAGQGRRHPGHHRGDEDVQPDRGRGFRHRAQGR